MASPILAPTQPRASARAASEPPAPALRQPPAGGIEDQYRSLYLIGRGGMGTVEVAVERQGVGFDRIVALKRLLPEGARDPRHKEMFLREARLAALLTHPNVVHAFAFGELGGELFMAMEYVEGEPLSQVLRAAGDNSGGLDPILVAYVLAQVCDGLHAAHELRDGGQSLRVVHRDVSPHNVMIAYEGFVKLLDFGVAKFDAGGNETRTGEVKGKMAYMSPEQALGERLDRRSDLFSVGAVLFECLTGRRMWGSGTDLDVMRKIALQSPPRIDTPGVPRALVELHMRLVARDPEKRPASAADVAAELREVVASSSVPALDANAVRTLMGRLFASEAQERRAKLTESLSQSAVTSVEPLRKSVEKPTAIDQPPTARPMVLRAPPLGRPPRTRRAGLLFRVLVLVLLGAVVAASAAMRKSVPPAAHANSTPTIAAATATVATGGPIGVAASQSTPPAPAVAEAPSTPKPLRAAAREAPAAPAPSESLVQPSIRTPLARPHPSAQTPTPLPDVDPTPF